PIARPNKTESAGVRGRFSFAPWRPRHESSGRMNTLSSLPRFIVSVLLVSAASVFAQPAAPAPAPVPAAVAIVRPTPAELTQANDSLQKFLAQADPATKAVVAKFPELIAVRPPRVNPAVVPFLAPGFRAKHAANQEIAKKGDIDVLFMGDSI